MDDFCFWIAVDTYEYWEAECNEKGFEFNDGGPVDNGFMFCPYCGRTMKEDRPNPQDEES